MARPLRVHIPGVLYHVMSRGNARQQIFLDAEDYARFLTRLTVTSERLGVRCRAYCLMVTHFHLLLEPNLFPLSRMMQQLSIRVIASRSTGGINASAICFRADSNRR